MNVKKQFRLIPSFDFSVPVGETEVLMAVPAENGPSRPRLYMEIAGGIEQQITQTKCVGETIHI